MRERERDVLKKRQTLVANEREQKRGRAKERERERG